MDSLMFQKLQKLLAEDELPKETYKPAHTEEELRARAPDASLPPIPLSTWEQIQRIHGPAPPPSHPNLQIVDEHHSPPDSDADAEQRMQRVDMAPAARTKRQPAVPKKFTTKHSPVNHVSPSNGPANGQGQPPQPSVIYNPYTKLGQPADPNQSFSPIVAVSRYPYKFVPKHLSEKIAEKFFVDSKFWYREWDVYYIWSQAQNAAKPILLIPSLQLEKLLNDINDAIEECHLTIGSEAEDFGLVVNFPNHPELLPRYLGRCHSREAFCRLERNVPDIKWRPTGEVRREPSPDERTKEACRQQLEMAYEVSRGRNKANKAAKKEARVSKQQQWKDSLKRAERYLGLRPGPHRAAGKLKPFCSSIETVEVDFAPLEPRADAPWSELQAYHNDFVEAKFRSKFAPPINPTLPPPYSFDKSHVFVAIDVECYEHDKSKVTEIGIATLDVLNLSGIAPGPTGVNWQSKIHTRHFLIREHIHLHNNDFVVGCPGSFEFGCSEIINMVEASAKIAECFRLPFSAASTSHGFSNGNANGTTNGVILKDKRNIVLVGHDVSQDIRYLTRVGYNVNSQHAGSIGILDTSELHRALIREWQPHSLAGILLEFDLQAWNLHNAGNDAVYTLWAMFAVCIKSASERGSPEAKKRVEEKRKEAVKDAVAKASERAMEELEGWSDEGEELGNEHRGVKVNGA